MVEVLHRMGISPKYKQFKTTALIFTLNQCLNKFEEYNGTNFFDFPTPKVFYRQVIGSKLYHQE